jgi:hypothetical protein
MRNAKSEMRIVFSHRRGAEDAEIIMGLGIRQLRSAGCGV